MWAGALIDAEQMCGKGPVSLGKIQSRALHSSAWWEDERQGTQVERREVQLEYKEDLSVLKGSQVWEKVAQRGCTVSILVVYKIK